MHQLVLVLPHSTQQLPQQCSNCLPLLTTYLIMGGVGAGPDEHMSMNRFWYHAHGKGRVLKTIHAVIGWV